MKATVILGAGFSNDSGLPVQSKIPEYLINYKSYIEFENIVSNILKKFMQDVFGYTGGNNYPSLDDMFTCIDISTNSGHHLGLGYSPLHLRAVRRLLVYRVYSILDSMYRPDNNVIEFFNVLFKSFDNTDFIVLNWDTVLERYLMNIKMDVYIDYGSSGMNWRDYGIGGKEKIKVFKIHGSSNWLYCDNCRTIFYDMLNEVSILKKSGFQLIDQMLFPELNVKGDFMLEQENCVNCSNNISSHIATFSYRKSFRVNSFSNVWNNAECSLADSDRWIFIGYSLPEADYEFKHMLKISELKYKHRNSLKPEIDVILLNSDNTIYKYNCFFGKNIGYICNGGIKKYSEHLHEWCQSIKI